MEYTVRPIEHLTSSPAWQSAPKRALRMPKHPRPLRLNAAGALVLLSALSVVAALAAVGCAA